MAKVLYLKAQTPLNRKLSRMPGVRSSVRKFAEKRAGVSRAILAGHRDTGNAYVEVTHGRTDSIISLVDPPAVDINGVIRPGNARAIEFGHQVWRNNEVVGRARGLYIITGPVFGWSA